MKNLIYGLVGLITLSCDTPAKNTINPYPVLLKTDPEWVTYEGLIPLTGVETSVELSLKAGSTRESSFFNLIGNNAENEQRAEGQVFLSWYGHGNYSILHGSPDERFIQLTAENFSWDGPNRKPRVQAIPLSFKILSDYELVLVDDDFEPVVPSYILTRRSDLFTVEGYFTLERDTSDFFEKNTQKKWAVSKLGSYPEAVARYRKLAKEEYEGIYMKALGYSVTEFTKEDKETQILVFKKILVMGALEERAK